MILQMIHMLHMLHKLIHFTLATLLCLLPIGLIAQPAPAPAQQEPIAIIGATLHIGNGQEIQNSVILFENGRITAVDIKSRNTEWQKDKYKQIQAEGKHVYPGLIAMNTSLGLNEIGAIPATQDVNEYGPDNANARTIVAYDALLRLLGQGARITHSGARALHQRNLAQRTASEEIADEGWHGAEPPVAGRRTQVKRPEAYLGAAEPALATAPKKGLLARVSGLARRGAEPDLESELVESHLPRAAWAGVTR